VPLPAVHHLREALNAVPLEEPVPAEVFAPYDAPVIAGAVKLWLLELDPPLALWEGWDDIRKIYPAVGAAAKSESGDAEAQRITDLGTALQRLPKVHLYVLDAIVSHLRRYVLSFCCVVLLKKTCPALLITPLSKRLKKYMLPSSRFPLDVL
jgi:hypothetical protein